MCEDYKFKPGGLVGFHDSFRTSRDSPDSVAFTPIMISAISVPNKKEYIPIETQTYVGVVVRYMSEEECKILWDVQFRGEGGKVVEPWYLILVREKLGFVHERYLHLLNGKEK